jgi:hypothetical protein
VELVLDEVGRRLVDDRQLDVGGEGTLQAARGHHAGVAAAEDQDLHGSGMVATGFQRRDWRSTRASGGDEQADR